MGPAGHVFAGPHPVRRGVGPVAVPAGPVRGLDEMHQAFNFGYLESEWDAANLRSVIDRSMAANDAVGAPTTWVLSNHDVVRHVSRPRPAGRPAQRHPRG